MSLQVKSAITAAAGDLDAAEVACAEMQIGMEGHTPPPQPPVAVEGKGKGKGKRTPDDEDALLAALHKRVEESGELLKGLKPPVPPPVTERTTFANYVRDSLVTMSKPKFKKARLAMNRILSEVMEDDSDGEEEVPRTTDFSMGCVTMPVRPQSAMSASSSGWHSSSSHASKSPAHSPCQAFQPLPHQWRHQAPPGSSVWASQTQEYVDQYMQQPLQQPVQQPVQHTYIDMSTVRRQVQSPSADQQSMPPPPGPVQPTSTSGPVQLTSTSVVLASAASALNQSTSTPGPSTTAGTDTSLLNLSGLSGISNLSRLILDPQDLVGPPSCTTELNTPPSKPTPTDDE